MKLLMKLKILKELLISFTLKTNAINPNKAGVFEGIFACQRGGGGGGPQFDPPPPFLPLHISR